MIAKELALRHMKIIFDGKDPRNLNTLLHDQFTFRGPFYQFSNKHDYIQSFIENPPRDFQYRILHISEDHNSVCIIYEFEKRGMITPMAQLFRIKEERIHEILLIFDSRPFGTPG
jgi:hypothetical protein